jgi:hypothetical protein
MDPYKILEVRADADSREILQAAAKAMKERKYSAKEIAIAQKTLLNPVKKAEELFKNIDFDVILKNYDVIEPEQKPTEALKCPLDASTL